MLMPAHSLSIMCHFFSQSQPIKYMNQLVTIDLRISLGIKVPKWVKWTDKEMPEEIMLCF